MMMRLLLLFLLGAHGLYPINPSKLSNSSKMELKTMEMRRGVNKMMITLLKLK
jgi:hypothetical protein